MDDYDPGFICNHSDHNGRYGFNQQPFIGLWNLSCLAQALFPLVPKEELKVTLDRYTPIHQECYLELMRLKLRLEGARSDDESLVNDLLLLMVQSQTNYTNVLRALGDFHSVPGEHNEGLRDYFVDRGTFDGWLLGTTLVFANRAAPMPNGRADAPRQSQVRAPQLLAQTGIEKAQQKDFSNIDRLLTLL
jgi:uncharacterized protein YdiU (UPF0061 family)